MRARSLLFSGVAVVLGVTALWWWRGSLQPANRATVTNDASPVAAAGAARQPRGPRNPKPDDEAAAVVAPQRPVLVAPDLPSPAQAAKLALRAASFKASDPSDDFADPVPPGHDAKAVRIISRRFREWTHNAENANADVVFLGIDCKRPPCVMSMQYNADRGNGFLDRAEAWLGEQQGMGKAQSFSHVLDADHQRLWTWYNPHPAGSSARHQYELHRLQEIRKEIETLPDYNPSRDSATP